MPTYPQEGVEFLAVHFAPLCNCHVLRVAGLFAVEKESSPYSSFLLQFIQQQLHLEIWPSQRVWVSDISFH